MGEFGYENISATHLEFNTAIENDIPYYIYTRDRTDAELTLYERCISSKNDWEGGRWVSKNDEDLLKMLSKHKRLRLKDKPSWLTVFRDSVELKKSITNDLKPQQYNMELAKIIADGMVPILSANCETDKMSTDQYQYTVVVKNEGKRASIAEKLCEQHIQDSTIAGARRNTPLTEKQIQTNNTKSRIRVRVEHIFGTIDTSLAGAEQRCIGFTRNAAMIIFTNLVCNMTQSR